MKTKIHQSVRRMIRESYITESQLAQVLNIDKNIIREKLENDMPGFHFDLPALRALFAREVFFSPHYLLYGDEKMRPGIINDPAVMTTPTGRLMVVFASVIITQTVIPKSWQFFDEGRDLEMFCYGDLFLKEGIILQLIRDERINPVFIYDRHLSDKAPFFISENAL